LENTESIPLRREFVNVAVLFALTTEVMERQAAALGISVSVRIDDDVPDAVRVDRDKVAWVITSLVGGALRHVRAPGGHIDVHASYELERQMLSIEVRDDGPGIAAEQLKKLLNRQGWRPGAALALLLVEDIAVAHGGRLDIDSVANPRDHFTAIRFTVPAPGTF
jgi:signal transduction histidine kinase